MQSMCPYKVSPLSIYHGTLVWEKYVSAEEPLYSASNFGCGKQANLSENCSINLICQLGVMLRANAGCLRAVVHITQSYY
jgi:hypothetical protein